MLIQRDWKPSRVFGSQVQIVLKSLLRHNFFYRILDRSKKTTERNIHLKSTSRCTILLRKKECSNNSSKYRISYGCSTDKIRVIRRSNHRRKSEYFFCEVIEISSLSSSSANYSSFWEHSIFSNFLEFVIYIVENF